MFTKNLNLSDVKSILAYLIQYSRREKKKVSMEQLYPYYTRWGGNILVFLHIFGTVAISLLLCDHQDTESESWGIEMSISQLIFTQKISHPILEKISTLYKMWENIVVTLHICGAIPIFLLLCHQQDTESE